MSVHEKASRLLAEGRVFLGHWVTLEDGTVTAQAAVRGQTGTYQVTIDPTGAWCTCPARRRCSHIEATRRAVQRERVSASR